MADADERVTSFGNENSDAAAGFELHGAASLGVRNAADYRDASGKPFADASAAIQPKTAALPPDADAMRAEYAEMRRKRDGYSAPNQSGIVPTRFTVLVKPDEVPEFSKGGLALPPAYRDPRNAAAVTGRVIDIADEAFSFIADPATRRPQVGDRIAFTKYAGMVIHGADKEIYKLMNDEDISAILEFAAPTHLN